MNISIIPNIYSYNNVQSKVNTSVKYPNLAPLKHDTVSFTSAMSISESIWGNYVKELPRLQRIATVYLDATEAVANKFKEDGVFFVREMFENTAVKAPDSKLSKVNRSKNFVVRDPIRTILFVKNPYDLSILFEKIIPEYTTKRGYKIASIAKSIGKLIERGYVPVEEEKLISKFFEIEHTKESHTKYFRELKKYRYGYDEAKKMLAKYLKEGKTPNSDENIEIAKLLKKYVPDVDIRLDKNMIDMSAVPEEYRYAIGKPQKSGYEDIQLRFIRDVDKDKQSPIYHELIIQFGPTYNRNAFKEHELVYEPLRLFEELHIPLNMPVKGEVNFREYPEKGVEKFISDIKDMFRTKVSKVLINNGKNEDYFGDVDGNDEIFFNSSDIKKFERRFSNINGFLREYYKQQIAKAQISSMASGQISKDQKDDLKLLKNIKLMFVNTIETLNNEHDLKG